MIQKLLAIVLIIIASPVILLIFVIVTATSKGPFFFIQKRIGKDKRIFSIYKIRTMNIHAEDQKKNFSHLNESCGPVFKIRHDPRHTKIGRFLSHTGIDELPQLINIIKGDMAFIGPRPLPVDEANQIPEKYKSRFSVLPGITSPWVINGAHKLSFDTWMRLDLEYVQSRSWLTDLEIAKKTILLIISMITTELKEFIYGKMR